jgi:hypothetical protein
LELKVGICRIKEVKYCHLQNKPRIQRQVSWIMYKWTLKLLWCRLWCQNSSRWWLRIREITLHKRSKWTRCSCKWWWWIRLQCPWRHLRYSQRIWSINLKCRWKLLNYSQVMKHLLLQHKRKRALLRLIKFKNSQQWRINRSNNSNYQSLMISVL